MAKCNFMFSAITIHNIQKQKILIVTTVSRLLHNAGIAMQLVAVSLHDDHTKNIIRIN